MTNEQRGLVKKSPDLKNEQRGLVNGLVKKDTDLTFFPSKKGHRSEKLAAWPSKWSSKKEHRSDFFFFFFF